MASRTRPRWTKTHALLISRTALINRRPADPLNKGWCQCGERRRRVGQKNHAADHVGRFSALRPSPLPKRLPFGQSLRSDIFAKSLIYLARSERFELPTLRFEVPLRHFCQAIVRTRLCVEWREFPREIWRSQLTPSDKSRHSLTLIPVRCADMVRTRLYGSSTDGPDC
jgi:hypothetical protein